MKKILVPTDFSDTSFNAVKFAADLALKYQAELCLLNCYHLPSSSSSVMINLQDILEQDSNLGLEEQQKQLKEIQKYSELKITTFSVFGLLNECIQNYINTYSIEVVVMGTTGAGKKTNQFFGSNTSKLMKRLDVPLFIVPANTSLNFDQIIFSVSEQPNKYEMPS